MDAEQTDPEDDDRSRDEIETSGRAKGVDPFPFDYTISRVEAGEDLSRQLPAPSETGGEAPEADPTPELFTALTQLLLGGSLQGGDLLAQQLREWQRQNPTDTAIQDAKADETTADRRRYALLGLLVEAAGRVDQGLKAATGAGNSAARLLLRPLGWIGNSLPMRPVKNGVDALARRGERQVDRWAQKGRAVELRSRKMSQEVVVSSVDEAAGYFSNSEEIQVLIKGQIELLAGNLPSTPEMDELVRALAANYLSYLQQDPQVLQPLIQNQADVYLDYLEQNPETVQDIISGQSLGLAASIRDQIRERLISIDYLIEKLLRAILRKPPRWEMDPPPEAVRERAEFGWQPVSQSPKKLSVPHEQ